MFSVMVLFWYLGYGFFLMFGAIFPFSEFDMIVNHIIAFTWIKTRTKKKKKKESRSSRVWNEFLKKWMLESKQWNKLWESSYV